MHNIQVNPWRNLYICVCVHIISDKIFRENRNLHGFSGHTVQSSNALSFRAFFFSTKFAWKREDIREDLI